MPHIVDNPDAVAEWLRGKTDLPEAKDLVVTALERALMREDELVVPAFMVDDDQKAKGYRFSTGWMSAETLRRIEHVVDWIVASVVNQAPWLDKVDAAGRPLKLAKLVSLDRAVFEADKAMRISAGGAPKTAVGLGEVVFMDLDEGWKIVRMTSPEALDTESSRMQHCVGHGAYDRRLGDKSSIFLSLRDPSGGPHATLEVEPRTNSLVQIRGKQNRLPERRYVTRLMPCILDLVCADAQMRELRLIWDRNGILHDREALPDVFEHAGTLELSSTETGLRLPSEKLTVHGDLAIYARRGTTAVLPRAIHVTGTLRLLGNLRILASDSDPIVENATFVFPTGVDLDTKAAFFNHCFVDGLPDGLELESLDLFKTSTGALPRGLRAGRLEITEGDLTALPDDMQAKVLTLKDSSIASLPLGLKLDELNILNCESLTSIPDDMRTGKLVVKGSGIASLPESMEVLDLQLRGCSHLEKLPDDLVVGGTARIVDTPLVSLGARMKVVGELRLERMKRLRRLPSDLVVGSLTIVEGRFPGLPDVIAAQSIRIEGCGDIDLPSRLCFEGSLTLVRTMPKKPFESLRLGGTLEIAGYGEMSVSPMSSIGGDMILKGDKGSIVVGTGTKVGGKSDIREAMSVVIGADVDFGSQVNFLHIEGSLELASGLHVAGPLNIVSCAAVGIPEDFGFERIELNNCWNCALPSRLVVPGYVSATLVKFVSMPDILEIGGSLNLDSCSGIVLPDDLMVEGEASFICSDDMVVGKNADFRGNVTFESPITSLGEGFRVARNLRGGGLKHIPAGSVIDTLFRPFKLKTIGTGCRFDTVILDNGSIRNLPSGMTVTNRMEIHETHISELPLDLVVEGQLVLSSKQAAIVLPKGVDPDKVAYVGRGRPADQPSPTMHAGF